MKRWKAALKKLLFPGWGWVVLAILLGGISPALTFLVFGAHRPFAYMSARDDLPAKQKGFQLGIDDYMVKPIELDELLLRRANIEIERKITVGNLMLDADAMTAEVDGEELPVTTREFNILYKLLSYPKKAFSRAQLMDEFWGWTARPACGRWLSTSPSCETNSPAAMALRSRPSGGWATRRC